MDSRWWGSFGILSILEPATSRNARSKHVRQKAGRNMLPGCEMDTNAVSRELTKKNNVLEKQKHKV